MGNLNQDMQAFVTTTQYILVVDPVQQKRKKAKPCASTKMLRRCDESRKEARYHMEQLEEAISELKKKSAASRLSQVRERLEDSCQQLQRAFNSQFFKQIAGDTLATQLVGTFSEIQGSAPMAARLNNAIDEPRPENIIDLR